MLLIVDACIIARRERVMNEYIYLCETQSRIIKRLEDENEELRELVRSMQDVIIRLKASNDETTIN